LLVPLVVAFLPFPTRLAADTLHNEGAEPMAATIHGLTLLAIRILEFALDADARRGHLYSPQQTPMRCRARDEDFCSLRPGM